MKIEIDPIENFIRRRLNLYLHFLKGSALLFLFSLLFLFPACTPEKKLKEAEYLLVRNKITSDNKTVPVSEKIAYVVQPRPNKRMLGLFLSKASIYQAMIPVEKPRYETVKRKMRNTVGQYPILLDTVSNDCYLGKWDSTRLWIQKTFGEPPVLLDSGLIDYSVKQINLMMKKMGYYNAVTDYSVSLKNKRAKVFYKITAGTPYRIMDIQYDIADPVIARIILADTGRSLLQRGILLDDEIIDNERTRIEERILNRGYVYFSKNHIRYEADTSLGNGNTSLKVIIQNQQYKMDDSTFVESHFRCYKIQSIDVYTDDPNLEYENYDTIFYTEAVTKTDTNHYRVFLPAGSRLYKPSALVYPLVFGTDDVYSFRRFRNSYDRYSGMRNFGYTKIAYTETEESKANFTQDTGYLDCKVQLIKLPRHSYNYDFFAKNTGGVYGLGGSISYSNRNLFRAAEIFSLEARYVQELKVDSSWHFHNFEAGVNASIEFPRFLFPIKYSKNFRPSTLISLGGNYIRHDYYSRFLFSTNFTYNWIQRVTTGKFFNHTFTVIDFSLIKMSDNDILNAFILEHKFSTRMQEKYKDHFMLGSKYGFTMQRSNKYVLRTQFNLYGHALYGIMKSLDALGVAAVEKSEDNPKQYVIWGIPFGSCISGDFDLVYNLMQRKRQALIYHLAVGIGVPTVNSTVMPYEKSFYLGGSNSMRAWRLRSLGPGSYVDTSEILFERVGDIKFETNLEFRTPIYKRFTLGTFIDIGNIWLIKKSDGFSNGEFAFNRFYKELAIDAGIGLRIDMSFLIIRIDYALKIRDPAKQESNGWQIFNWSGYDKFKADRAIVFGIGYPF